jgi:hypothetical protein
VFGDAFYGHRSVTLTGKIGANFSASDRNTALLNLQRALRGLRSSFTLKSTASGLPAMQCSGRLEALRVSGSYLKDFQIQVVCADPRIYSQALTTLMASGTVTTPGAAFPWAFDVNWGGGTGATQAVNPTNVGNFTAPCTLVVWGPCSSPQITNATTGESIYIDSLTLAAGEYVTVDTLARTVVKNDGTSVYAKVRFPGTTWFGLAPGSNTIQLWATATTAATELDCSWRDTWA